DYYSMIWHNNAWVF
nr:immunoglobulin light chain junction region [Macaca mulatta]